MTSHQNAKHAIAQAKKRVHRKLKALRSVKKGGKKKTTQRKRLGRKGASQTRRRCTLESRHLKERKNRSNPKLSTPHQAREPQEWDLWSRKKVIAPQRTAWLRQTKGVYSIKTAPGRRKKIEKKGKFSQTEAKGPHIGTHGRVGTDPGREASLRRARRSL